MHMLVTYIYNIYKAYVSSGLSSLGYNGSLVTWTVVCLTAAKFEWVMILPIIISKEDMVSISTFPGYRKLLWCTFASLWWFRFIE
jgi:hypothetical protein